MARTSFGFGPAPNVNPNVVACAWSIGDRYHIPGTPQSQSQQHLGHISCVYLSMKVV